MAADSDWDAWHASRLSSVVSPTGNLSLIETRWEQNDHEISLEESLVGQPETVTVSREVRKNFNGEIISRGIRLWDANSLAIRSFETIDLYPFDLNWVIEATFTEHPESQAVAFEYIRDNGGTRDLVVPGEIKAVIEGEEYILNAFDDGDRLLLVFADLTNQGETYPSGRFLFVYRPDGSDQIILDFNRSFVPPCGFSIHYNCPLPPPQNRLHVAVRAGERYPVFRNGYKVQ